MSIYDTLRDEYLRHRAILETPPETPSFASDLMRSSLQARVSELDAEMKAIERSQVQLRLVDATDPSNHGLETDVLLKVLKTLQRFMDFAGWSNKAGPISRGNVPADIRHATATRTLALSPGSFVVELERLNDLPNIDGQTSLTQSGDLFKEAVEDLYSIVEIAASGQFEDAVDLVERTGPAANKQVASLFRALADERLNFELNVAGLAKRPVSLDPTRADDFRTWLVGFDESEKTAQYTGVFSIVNTEQGRFALRLNDDTLIQGKADPAELAGVTVENKRYRATISTKRSVSQHSGQSRETSRLLSFTELQD